MCFTNEALKKKKQNNTYLMYMYQHKFSVAKISFTQTHLFVDSKWSDCYLYFFLRFGFIYIIFPFFLHFWFVDLLYCVIFFQPFNQSTKSKRNTKTTFNQIAEIGREEAWCWRSKWNCGMYKLWRRIDTMHSFSE